MTAAAKEAFSFKTLFAMRIMNSPCNHGGIGVYSPPVLITTLNLTPPVSARIHVNTSAGRL